VKFDPKRNAFFRKIRVLSIALLLAHKTYPAQITGEGDIKFAFYSSAWSVDSDDGMRLILFNSTNNELILNSITFLKEQQESEFVEVGINTKIPPLGYAEEEFEYIDLLQGNGCITRTLAENWKLVEVSNYTLNPSVRNLIIEDTGSFRIYQCSEYVKTKWTNTNSNEEIESMEWVLFHFEIH